MRIKNKAFTLIELIVVLVILAVIALIATPIVLNIVDKAQVSANKRSVDAYGKAVDLAVAEYLLDTGDYPTTFDDLDVKYSGNEVVCNVKKINEQGSIYISECSVDDVKVKDDTTNDGYYHYSSYSYKVYKVGDKITYNGIDFYVIEDSGDHKDSVTLLKAEPLTVEEVNKYGTGHINKYTYNSKGTAFNENGYGGMAYYTSSSCGRVNGSSVYDDCTTDYNQSDVKYVVDAWVTAKLGTKVLKKDSLGYKARLITYEELTTNLGYENSNKATVAPSTNGETPSWVYNSNYNYWGMGSYNDSSDSVVVVRFDGIVGYGSTSEYVVVRPVVTLLKSAI